MTLVYTLFALRPAALIQENVSRGVLQLFLFLVIHVPGTAGTAL